MLFEALVKENIVPQTKANAKRGGWWDTFSRAVADSAAFIETIDDIEKFSKDVGANEFAMLGALALIESGIKGYGFALAADVLKECGFIDSIKPDTHIKKLAAIIGLDYRNNDVTLLILLNRACLKANISAYAFDKFVWLVFSGRFYEQPELNLKFDLPEYGRRITEALRVHSGIEHDTTVSDVTKI